MDKYEWDTEKREVNLVKHGLDFNDVWRVFKDPKAVTFEDIKHSSVECRLLTIGYLDDILCTVVVHTKRGNRIRIISFRPANKKERIQYDNG